MVLRKLVCPLLMILRVVLRQRWCDRVRIGRLPHMFPSSHAILAISYSFFGGSLGCLAGPFCSKIASIHESAPMSHLHDTEAAIPLSRFFNVLVGHRILPHATVYHDIWRQWAFARGRRRRGMCLRGPRRCS